MLPRDRQRRSRQSQRSSSLAQADARRQLRACGRGWRARQGAPRVPVAAGSSPPPVRAGRRAARGPRAARGVRPSRAGRSAPRDRPRRGRGPRRRRRWRAGAAGRGTLPSGRASRRRGTSRAPRQRAARPRPMPASLPRAPAEPRLGEPLAQPAERGATRGEHHRAYGRRPARHAGPRRGHRRAPGRPRPAAASARSESDVGEFEDELAGVRHQFPQHELGEVRARELPDQRSADPAPGGGRVVGVLEEPEVASQRSRRGPRDSTRPRARTRRAAARARGAPRRIGSPRSRRPGAGIVARRDQPRARRRAMPAAPAPRAVPPAPDARSPRRAAPTTRARRPRRAPSPARRAGAARRGRRAGSPPASPRAAAPGGRPASAPRAGTGGCPACGDAGSRR